MVLDSMVDVQCRDIGLETVLIFGEGQGGYLVAVPKAGNFQ